MADEFPKNLIEFTRRFADPEACTSYLMDLRWPKGFACPGCGGGKGWPTARGTVFCAECERQTSPTAGTILHRSHVPVSSWFLAMWLACTQKTGLSAAGLQRELGLGSYRTAWLMLQKLRQAMVRIQRERLQGVVQVDETYVGGEETQEGVRGRQLAGKALVVLAVELEGQKIGRIRLRHIPKASAEDLLGFVGDVVQAGATVHTDGWPGYSQVAMAGFRHRVTQVSNQDGKAITAFPQVHLVASLLKRWLLGTHHGKVGPKHLQRYLDEFTFRFNRRRSTHVGKVFYRLAEQLVLHRAHTYREIIGKLE
jgi:transposase-like protein